MGETTEKIKIEKRPEERVISLLLERGLKISTAESCTGGLVAATLVNVPGASEVFEEGYITYSNKAKRKNLGVKKTTLKEYGAVSKQTAKEMCCGCLKAAKADVALSVTGIAGPDGGTEEKPVGLVYIGCCFQGKTKVIRCQFEGDRSEIRAQSVQEALVLAEHCILAN